MHFNRFSSRPFKSQRELCNLHTFLRHTPLCDEDTSNWLSCPRPRRLRRIVRWKRKLKSSGGENPVFSCVSICWSQISALRGTEAALEGGHWGGSWCWLGNEWHHILCRNWQEYTWRGRGKWCRFSNNSLQLIILVVPVFIPEVCFSCYIMQYTLCVCVTKRMHNDLWCQMYLQDDGWDGEELARRCELDAVVHLFPVR